MTLVARLGRSIGPVGRKGASAAAITGVASALDLVSFAIIARILSRNDLGILLIALAVGTIVERLGSPNLSQTFFRHTIRAVEKRRPSDLRRIIDLAVLFELSLLLLGLVSGILAATLIAPIGDRSIFAAIVIATMFTALRPPLLSIAIPRAFGRHEAVAACILLGALTKVTVVAAVMFNDGGLVGIAMAFALGSVVIAIGGIAITLLQARGHGALSVKRSDRNAFAEKHKEFWALSRVGAITVLPQAILEFSTILLGILSGVVQAGIYRLSTKVGEAAGIYTSPIALVVYSDQCKSVEQRNMQRFRDQTIRWSLTLGAVTTFGLALFLLAGNSLVELIFGEGYANAVPAITICVAAAVPSSMASPLSFGLFALGATTSVLRAESIAAVLFLVIILVLREPTAEQAATALAIGRGAAFATLVALFVLALRRRSPGG